MWRGQYGVVLGLSVHSGKSFVLQLKILGAKTPKSNFSEELEHIFESLIKNNHRDSESV